jgi:hypothetical protein
MYVSMHVYVYVYVYVDIISYFIKVDFDCSIMLSSIQI